MPQYKLLPPKTIRGSNNVETNDNKPKTPRAFPPAQPPKIRSDRNARPSIAELVTVCITLP